MAGSVSSEDGDMGFQIAPMVDVVFVLMLFFMASAGSQVAERELNMNLPGSKSPSTVNTANEIPPIPIMVDISSDGQVSVNKQSYGSAKDKDLNALREFFKQSIEQFDSKNPVILHPDSETRHERIMDVLNAAGVSGVKNLTFS
jgi:biopolymer transport protein ExbD